MSRSRASEPVPGRVPDEVARVADLRAAGVSNYVLSTRCRPSGAWRRLLPGVVLLSSRPPTRRQLVRAALLYAGQHAVLTGLDALSQHGVPVPIDAGPVRVLIPAGQRTAGRGFLCVERTTRLPAPMWRDGLPLAPVPRAALDVARREPDRQRLRAALLAPVRAGACTIEDLLAELDAGGSRGSAAPRAELSEYRQGPLPLTIGLARRVLRGAPLPAPLWQVPLSDQRGRPLGIADAWWDDIGLAWDFGAQRSSRPPGGSGHPRIGSAGADAGVTVVRTDPERLRTDRETVLRELAAAFTEAARRPRPAVRCW